MSDEPSTSTDQPSAYPRQALSEQQVQPGRSRTPLIVVAVAVLVAAVAGLVSWLLLDDDGEVNRQAYCAALTEVTDGGDLMGALGRADRSTIAGFERVADLAPDAVSGDWDTLTSLARDPAALDERDMVSTAMNAYAALRSIAADAEDNCDLDLDIPLR